MEDALERKLDNIYKESENVTGLLVTDKQGLCIKTVGDAKEESSGIIAAINDIVTRLEPTRSTPTVIMESENKCCIIYSGKNTNAVVFRNVK